MAESVGNEQSRPRLQMAGVCKRFGATIALSGVDFDVLPGEVHALVGENGAGKSTLMKVLSGAEKPDEGRMFLDGKPFYPETPLHARCEGVAMIYQELSLADHLTVEENISLGVEPAMAGLVSRGRDRDAAADALDQLGHGGLVLDARVGDLSIAERQIVEIARAMATGCRVLILDEPTSSLARSDVEHLFSLVARLKEQGHAIVYISHFIEEVRDVADRFTVLRDGQTVGTGDTDTASFDEIVSLMVGRQVEQLYPRSPRTQGEPVLEVQHLVGRSKPSDASLTLYRGDVLGIAGLVGAGRTELLRAIFSLDRVVSGDVRVALHEGGADPARRLAQGVGMLSENRKDEGLATEMTIADNVTLSRMEGLGPPGCVLPGAANKATHRWIDTLGVRCASPRQRVNDLSGGNQQKVAIARLLHHDVDVLLLDEPTRGIDVASKAQIYRLVDELASGPADGNREARAILMVSSYLPELMGICDRIAVMHRGRLGEARRVADWTEHELLLEATGANA